MTSIADELDMLGIKTEQLPQIRELLGHLAEGRFRVVDEQIRMDSRAEVTAELRAILPDLKDAIIEHLRAAESRRRGPQAEGHTGTTSATTSQEGVWLVNEMDSDSVTYVMSGVGELVGEVDLDRLTAAINQLVGAHDALRTALRVDSDGFPCLVDIGSYPVSLLHADCRNDQDRAERLIADMSQQPFDLESGELLRAAVCRVDDDRHILGLFVHHVACDAVSMGLLIPELLERYSASPEAAADEVEPSVPFHAYSDWRSASSSALRRIEQLLHWQAALADVDHQLGLVGDRPVPRVRTHSGSTVEFTLGHDGKSLLSEVATSCGATQYPALIALWAAFLGGYARKDQFVVGSAVSGRSNPALRDAVGFFVNTVPVPVDLEADPTIRQLISTVSESYISGMEHSDVGMPAIVESVGEATDASSTPLFQTLVSFYESPSERLDVGDLTFIRHPHHNGSAKFDLTLFVESNQDGLKFQLEYATDIFDQATASLMGDGFESFLSIALADLDRSVSGVSRQMAEGFSPIIGAETGEVSDLWDQIHASAQNAPERTAIEFGNEKVTYEDLLGVVSRHRSWLEAQGLRAGDRVGVHMERGLPQVYTLLALLSGGWVAVPIDKTKSAEEADRAFGIAVVDAFITDGEPSEYVSKSRKSLVYVEPSEAALSDRTHPASASDLMHIILTSGTTGAPKAIAMSRRAVSNLIAWQVSEKLAGESDRTLQFTPIDFDVSQMEIYGTLAGGGTLVLISDEDRRDPSELRRVVETSEITSLYLPYVVLQQLAETAFQADQYVRCLQNICVAGERLIVTDEIKAFFERTGARLHNHYGPAETHVVTAWTMAERTEEWDALPPIGQPVDGVGLELLDMQGAPVVPGGVGELVVTGPAVAEGYLVQGEADATSGGFGQSPGGQRRYATGDLVRMRPVDGALLFLGRKDSVVKVRGYQVDLADVERTLLDAPGVSAAVVMASGDGIDRRLDAWVVLTEEEVEAERRLRRWCEQTLARPAVPKDVVVVDSIPLTTTGKVDRRRLEDGAPGKVSSVAGSAADLVEAVADVMRDVLQRPKLGVSDDFFDAGGHSMAAQRVATRVSELLSAEVSARDLFDYPSAEALAKGKAHSRTKVS